MFLLAILPLSAGEDPGAARSAAQSAARRGDWRSAETHGREALRSCLACTVEERAILRGELAGYLTLGGFPEAAIPLWRQSLLELPVGSSRLRVVAELGLGVAFHAGGRAAAAEKAWARACGLPGVPAVERAACRFNLAAARMESGMVWGELEEILPVLLTVPGAVSRATALLQTARAATLEGKTARAWALLDEAEGVIVRELDERHPFRSAVYEARAEVAARRGDGKEAKLWRRKAARMPETKGWERGTVSVEGLRGKTR